MRILFAGTPAVAVVALDALVDAGHDVVGVLTRAPAPAGRGRKLVASPVAQRARALGLRVFEPAKARDPEFLAALTELAPDVCPVVAYGQLITKALLEVPRHGWVNLHFSLLPRWRGAAPVQRAIIAGDERTGACTFQIVPALDAGPLYRRLSDDLGPRDTADDVLARLAVTGSRLLVDTLADIAAGIAPTPQPDEGVTIAPKLTADDAEIDWSADVDTIDRLVRGCHSHPGAWSTFRGERFKIISARPTYGVEPAGQLGVGKREVLVGTGTRALALEQVQPFGKRPMAAADWARGVRIEAGERLAS